MGRLSSRCRVFAPIYRQVTSYGLTHPSAAPAGEPSYPILDVQAAWNYYLKNDNKGRGVVLIGHSQGTILLQELIAGSIDGKASQALLVSAFLPGNPSLGVPPGRDVGGTLAHIPTCSDAPQIGCVYVWGSYLPADTSGSVVFGRVRTDGLVSACVNPAAPSGGSGTLKFYHSNTTAPWWSELMGQFSGACQTDASGANVFVVTVKSGLLAVADTAILESCRHRRGLGTSPARHRAGSGQYFRRSRCRDSDLAVDSLTPAETAQVANRCVQLSCRCRLSAIACRQSLESSARCSCMQR